MTTAKMSLLLDQLFLLNQIVPELQKKKKKQGRSRERERGREEKGRAKQYKIWKKIFEAVPYHSYIVA